MKIFYKGEEVKIHEADVFPPPYHCLKQCNYVIIDGREKGGLIIELDCKPNNLVVRPRSANIKPEISEKKVKLNIDNPCNIALEADGLCLFVFAYNEPIVNAENYKNIIVVNILVYLLPGIFIFLKVILLRFVKIFYNLTSILMSF